MLPRLSVFAGNFGFDPLGLAKEPSSLARFRESELIHCRWAMLGVAGCLAVELLGYGNWYDAPLWVSRSSVLTALSSAASEALPAQSE